MKALLLICTLIAGTMAHAEDSRRETRTEATGQSTPIAGSISGCSIPIPMPIIDMSMITIESRAAFLSCVEYVSYEANVTGSFWNSKSQTIEGTQRKSYRLESRSVTNSQLLMGSEDRRYKSGRRPVDPLLYALTSTNLVTSCNQRVRQLLVVSQPLNQTPCAGQSGQ